MMISHVTDSTSQEMIIARSCGKQTHRCILGSWSTTASIRSTCRWQ
jgi:hypothetical protein